MKKAPLLCALLLLLGGCALPTETRQNYVLTAPTFEKTQLAQKGSLVVLPLEVASGLDTTRIALLDEQVSLSALSGAKWADPLPDLLQSVLTNTLRKNGFATAVSTDATGIKADKLLAVTVPAFQAERDENGALTIHIAYEAKELAPLTREVLKVARASETSPVTPQTQTDLIAAFDKANQKALHKLLDALSEK